MTKKESNPGPPFGISCPAPPPPSPPPEGVFTSTVNMELSKIDLEMLAERSRKFESCFLERFEGVPLLIDCRLMCNQYYLLISREMLEDLAKKRNKDWPRRFDGVELRICDALILDQCWCVVSQELWDKLNKKEKEDLEMPAVHKW